LIIGPYSSLGDKTPDTVYDTGYSWRRWTRVADELHHRPAHTVIDIEHDGKFQDNRQPACISHKLRIKDDIARHARPHALIPDDFALYSAAPSGLRGVLADDELPGETVVVEPDDRLGVGALWAVARKVAQADGAQVGGKRDLRPVEILA
jgi:hypothetical protein